MKKIIMIAIMTVAANTALAAGNETSGFGPAGSLELNGTLSETLAAIRSGAENFQVPAPAAVSGEPAGYGLCSIRDNTTERGIVVSYGDGRFMGLREPLSFLHDSDISHAAAAFKNPLFQAINEVRTAVQTGRCQGVRKASCSVKYLDMAPGTTHMARDRYSISVRYEGEKGVPETLPTYAKSPKQFKAALDALSEAGICEKQAASDLPVCSLEKSPYGGYELRFNGRVVEEFLLQAGGLKTLAEVRSLGLCR
ncbi:MAG: hypothetical protein NTY45_02595 [Elusimicrobia bacterium]|nr:hypothetical protein [Elusimicrobiota bacterium]